MEKWKDLTSEYSAKVAAVLPEIVSFLISIASVFEEVALKLYIVEAACQKLHPYESSCENVRADQLKLAPVEDLAASYFMWLRIFTIPMLFILPICGLLSDIIGRQTPVLISALGCVLASLIYLISTMNPAALMYLILLASAIRGFICKIQIIVVAMTAVVADKTPIEERAKRFSFLMSMKYIGNLVGLLFQGVMLKYNSYSSLYLANVCIFGLVVILCMVFMNEVTDKPKECTTKSNIPAKPSFNIFNSFRVLTEKPEKGSLIELWIYILIISVDKAVKSGQQDVTVLYINRIIPTFSSSDFSWSFAVETALSAFITIVIAHLVFSIWNIPDMYVAVFTVISAIFSLLSFNVVYNVPIYYVALIAGTPLALFIPIIRSHLSQIISENDFGKMFAYQACFETMAASGGPLVFLNIYTALSHHLSGFVYIVMALFHVVILLFLLCYLNKVWKEYERTYSIGCSDESSPLQEEKNTLQQENMTSKK